MTKVLTYGLMALGLSFASAAPVLAVGGNEPLKINSAGAVKGTNSVVIGAFNVGFIFQSIDSGKQTGGMIGAFGGTTRAKSVLDGVTPEVMQAIADAAYEDFRNQLSAKGFTVADNAGLFTAPDFGRVKTLAVPYDANVRLDKHSTGKASYFKPRALPSMFILPGDITASGMSGLGASMAAGTNQYAVSQYAKASGQTVIDVTYLIDFSDVKRPGAFSFGGLQVNSGMSVTDDYSRVSLTSPTGKVASIVVNQPIAVEGDFASRADTTGDKGLQTAANVAGGVAAAFGLGGMRFGKSRTFTFTAKESYRDGAIKAASLANGRILDQIAALR
jgi:hypothetical protein